MKAGFSFFVVIYLSLFSITSSAENWDKLFDHATYQNAKISPDGKHLAVKNIQEGEAVLSFINQEDMTISSTLQLTGRYEVGNYYWINNERVVIELVRDIAWLEEPKYFGELFAINIDGSKRKLIYGFRAGSSQLGHRGKTTKSTYGWAEIIDTLPNDHDHILISSTPMNKTGERLPQALLLNAYTGIVKNSYLRSPLPFADFITNTKGELVALAGVDGNNNNQIYLKNEDNWQPVAGNTFGDDVTLLSVDSSGQFIYTLDRFNQGRLGLFKYDLKSTSYSEVYTDKNVDITNVLLANNTHSVYALRLDDGYPEYLLLNKSLQEAKVFKNLLKSFPYNTVDITSGTRDDNYYVVMVSSDTNPGSLYLYNQQANTLKLLFKFHANITASELQQTEPIKFQATDATTLNGYFTPAKNFNKNSPAPVVVLVHGGPHGARNYWEFDPQVQYLALNGFSVLQVNYRGSNGYGEKFETAGYKAWGTLIQQDIFDAYQGLITQGKAKVNNACIMGGSFGAYSAIQSAILYPKNYKCAIANAGIYDLELMFEEGDVQESKIGLIYLNKILGNDKSLLKSMSPVNYVDKIEIPLLLAHGEDDERAPFEHALRLRKALDKANKPYEWFVVDKEEHGFYNPKNQKAYMKKVVSFLNKHLER